jgi:CDP-diacylglycerol--glycerol-3-phosphate 3-phosphatidyltransferase
MKLAAQRPQCINGHPHRAHPALVVVYYLPARYEWAHPAAALIFALAGLTDWLDGYLARRLGQTSTFGAFLDPVATS